MKRNDTAASQLKSDKDFLDGIYKKITQYQHLQKNKDPNIINNMESLIENFNISLECDLLKEEENNKLKDGYEENTFKNEVEVTFS